MWSSTAWTLEFALKYDVMDGGWYPQSAINGVIFSAVCKEVLYHHLARGNHLTHYVCLSDTKQRRHPSKYLFTITFWPSDWGWQEELWASWVPKQEINSVQKILVKMVSLSLTIIFGFPCSFWIVYIHVIANVLAFNGWYNAQKCG